MKQKDLKTGQIVEYSHSEGGEKYISIVLKTPCGLRLMTVDGEFHSSSADIIYRVWEIHNVAFKHIKGNLNKSKLIYKLKPKQITLTVAEVEERLNIKNLHIIK